MKKTCLFFVLGLLAATILYFVLIRRSVPEIHTIPSIGLAILGGFSALALFGAIANVVQTLNDRNVIARALKGEAFRDGKRAAAIGTLHPSGLASLTAPFSGRECIAYEYEMFDLTKIRHRGTEREIKKLHVSGFGMVPSQIRTSQGDIRILGFPLIDEFPLQFTETETDRARAETYLKQTHFHNVKKNIKSVFSEFDDLFQDADGAVRKDLGEPVPLEQKHRLTEIIVPDRAEVCAIGVYSKKDNALIAKRAALPIRYVPGNANEAATRLRKKGYSQIVFALLFFFAINGTLAFLYRSFVKDRFNMPESEQAKLLADTAAARDLEKLTLLLKNGLPPDATDAQSRTLLQNTRDPDVSRLLLQHGANPNVQDPATLETPIFEAARSGDLLRLKVLIDGKADVNAVSPIPWRHTAVDEALRKGQSDAADMLLKAGAKDPRITAATGSPLRPDAEELAACRAYLRAIQTADKEVLRFLTTPRYDYFFEDIDFAVWKQAYPITMETFEGFTNGKAATIQFRGSNGEFSEWIFLLEKEQKGWKVHQTWPLSGQSDNVIWR